MPFLATVPTTCKTNKIDVLTATTAAKKSAARGTAARPPASRPFIVSAMEAFALSLDEKGRGLAGPAQDRTRPAMFG